MTEIHIPTAGTFNDDDAEPHILLPLYFRFYTLSLSHLTFHLIF